MVYFYETRKGQTCFIILQSIVKEGAQSERASKILQGSVEMIALNQVPFIESPVNSKFKYHTKMI